MFQINISKKKNTIYECIFLILSELMSETTCTKFPLLCLKGWKYSSRIHNTLKNVFNCDIKPCKVSLDQFNWLFGNYFKFYAYKTYSNSLMVNTTVGYRIQSVEHLLSLDKNNRYLLFRFFLSSKLWRYLFFYQWQISDTLCLILINT